MARQSSPFADRTVPAPELCQVAPRSVSFFQDMGATPQPDAIATPVFPPSIPLIPGEPADEETIAGITATVREVIACTNAGDQLRIDALYTDDYFFRQAAMSGPPSAQFVEFLASPATPLPLAQRAAVYGVRDVQLLPDGRVRAVAGFHFPPDDVAFLTMFVRQGDRWLIDESVIVPFDGPSMTTPEP